MVPDAAERIEAQAYLRLLSGHIDAVETELAQLRTMHRANVTLTASTEWPADMIPPDAHKHMRRNLVRRIAVDLADRLDMGLVAFHETTIKDGVFGGARDVKRLTAHVTVQGDPLAMDGYERGRKWRGPAESWPDDLIEMMAFDIWSDLPVSRRRPYIEFITFPDEIWSPAHLDPNRDLEKVVTARKVVVEIRQDSKGRPFPRLVSR
jgi:metal-sulfur cluster biosynthetic enzyme